MRGLMQPREIIAHPRAVVPHALLRLGVQAGSTLGFGLRHGVDQEDTRTREVEEFGADDLFEQPG